MGAEGSLEETEVMVLSPAASHETVTVFSREVTPTLTGRLGYGIRISPNHFDDPLTRPCPDLLKWEE